MSLGYIPVLIGVIVRMKAFDIEAKLKPDMSKYLIHMTGKDSIKSILSGGRTTNEGLVKAQIPNGSKGNNFKSEIACFTETPIFALGAFIAISKRRKLEKMEYGIGFRKSYMVENNVRPTIYLDNQMLAEMFKVSKADNSQEVRTLLDSLRSLAHPLGETMPKQGFTWEREWRFVDKIGFYFDHEAIEAIEVICCPKDQQFHIRTLLGISADKIRFVDSWEQYREYTQHIKHAESKDKIGEILSSYDDFQIEEFLDNYEDHVDSLKQYKDYLLALQGNAEEIEKHISELVEWKKYIDANTAEHCGHFSEELVWRSDFGETFCPDCSRDYNEGLAKFMSKD
jgi:hypothetical protein